MPLRAHLAGHTVDTLAEKGWSEKDWSEKDNGELLDLAEQDGYEILLTTDQNLRHQQNIARRSIGVVVLLSANWPEISRFTHDIGQAVASAQPGEVIEVPIRVKWHDGSNHGM